MAEGSINRTLRVLVALAESGPQTLTALSAKTDLSPPTLLRLLRIMRDEGFADQGANREWHATMLLWRLGCAVAEDTGWGEASELVIRDLSRELDETAVLAAYEKGWVTYVAEAHPDRPVRTHVALGGRYPAASTQTGRAVLAWLSPEDLGPLLDNASSSKRAQSRLLSELEEVARLGYAHGGGDLWPGVWGAAAPVFGRYGEVVGAVGISVPEGRAPADLVAVASSLLQSAHRLTVQLGGPAGPPPSPLLAR